MNQLELQPWAAIALLSLALAGCSSETRAKAPPELSPEQQRGQRLFASTCMACHETRSPTARQGPSLQGVYKKPSLPSGAPANDDRVRDAILYGRRNMPGFQYLLNDQQISDLIAYLHTL